MKKKIRKYLFMIIIGQLFLVSCSSNVKKEMKKEESSSFILNHVENCPISFDYHFLADTLFEHATLAECRITNTGRDTIYYLSTTCNGLSAYSLVEPAFYIFNEVNCNMSWDVIQSLPPKESYAFRIHIMPKKGSAKPNRINLDLVCVDRMIDEQKVRSFTESEKTSLREYLKRK